MQIKKSERGQAIVIFAIAIVGLLAVVSMAIDLGRLYVERRNAQSAADAAVFAGAEAKIKNASAGLSIQNAAIISAARASAAKNGFTHVESGKGTKVYVYPDGPISGPYQGQADYIQVIIQSDFKTFFASLFGRYQLDNTSEAVVKATGRAAILGGDLVWGYNTSKCPTVSTNGGVDVILTNGNLFDNSAGRW